MQFGELAILKPDNPNIGLRSATCTAIEKSHLISLSKLYYRDMLLKDLNNDIEDRLLFMAKLPFF